MIRKQGMLAFILITALSGIGAAQTAPTDLVYVAATVTGPKKAPAPGLKQENFQLLEDGVEQKITFFAPPDGIWDMDLLLANSMLLPSRADRTSAAIRDAVETFKTTSNPMDRIRVDELKFGSDGLYAAIDRDLVDLQKTANPRKALVVITDGFDMPGGDASNALIEYSRKLNIPIYFLYTRTDNVPGSTTASAASTATAGGLRGATTADPSVGARGTAYSLAEGEALTNVAEQTGGAIYFVDPLHQLESQCKLLSEELRNKYVLGFKSTNDKQDDKWRKLKINLKAPSGPKLDLSVKAKYFVPKPVK
jgi:VWFA-related protein